MISGEKFQHETQSHVKVINRAFLINKFNTKVILLHKTFTSLTEFINYDHGHIDTSF